MTSTSLKTVCGTGVLLLAVSALGQEKTISEDGVSLMYDQSTFSKVEIVEVKKEPLPNAHDRLNVHPANLLFMFYEGSRYVGSIKLYPLEDGTVGDREAAYPELSTRAATLNRLLHERPRLPQRYPSGNPKEIPTIQNQMAGQYFLSNARYFNFSWGMAVGFLVQYAQDASEYAVGSRLQYEIEGITADEKIGVSAYFSVSHPDLPQSGKDSLVTDSNGEPVGEAAYMKYLRQMETLLDGKNETTFRPPLNSIQKIVDSLRFESADPAKWGAKFDGKTRAIE